MGDSACENASLRLWSNGDVEWRRRSDVSAEGEYLSSGLPIEGSIVHLWLCPLRLSGRRICVVLLYRCTDEGVSRDGPAGRRSAIVHRWDVRLTIIRLTRCAVRLAGYRSLP